MKTTVFTHSGAAYLCDELLSKIQRVTQFGFIRVSAPSLSLLESARAAVANVKPDTCMAVYGPSDLDIANAAVGVGLDELLGRQTTR